MSEVCGSIDYDGSTPEPSEAGCKKLDTTLKTLTAVLVRIEARERKVGIFTMGAEEMTTLKDTDSSVDKTWQTELIVNHVKTVEPVVKNILPSVTQDAL